MSTSLRKAFSPSAYRFGRPVAILCASYLVLVGVAAGYVVYDALFPPPGAVGASFAAVPLVVLTAPSSFVLAEPVALFQALALPADVSRSHVVVTSAITVAPFLAAAVAQAVIVWFLLRGSAVGTPVLNGRYTSL